MSLFAWADRRINRLRWYDIGLIKVGVAAFVLMLVTYWPALPSGRLVRLPDHRRAGLDPAGLPDA